MQFKKSKHKLTWTKMGMYPYEEISFKIFIEKRKKNRKKGKLYKDN